MTRRIASALARLIASGPQQATAESGAVTLNYGVFLNTVLDFLILAVAIFLLVKAMNAALRSKQEAPKPPPGPTPEQLLLTEIRDALRR